jgi:hypothetical protein
MLCVMYSYLQIAVWIESCLLFVGVDHLVLEKGVAEILLQKRKVSVTVIYGEYYKLKDSTLHNQDHENLKSVLSPFVFSTAVQEHES